MRSLPEYNKNYGACLSQDELIKYTRGLLSKEENYAVENHLLQCMLCSSACEGISMLDKNDDAAYRLQSLQEDYKIKKSTGVTTGIKKYISVAALFMAASAALFLYLSYNGTNSTFQKYYKPYPNVIPIVRGEGTDFNLKAAMVLYNSGNYEEAINEFDKLLAFEPGNEAASFYKGVALLSLHKGGNAVKEFASVINHGSTMFRDQAQWYLSMAYLLENKEKQADSVLAVIAKSNNYYSGRAKNALKELKE